MPEITPIHKFELSDHALMEMERRNITQESVREILAAPEQVEMVREGRSIYQAIIKLGDPLKPYVLRVFIDIDRDPPRVVTVYRTSKIDKYWR